MSSFLSCELSNGHLLTIVQKPVGTGAHYYAIEERNELGSFVCVAYSSRTLSDCEEWVARAQLRGFGYEPTIGYGYYRIAPLYRRDDERTFYAKTQVDALELARRRWGKGIALSCGARMTEEELRASRRAKLAAVASELDVELHPDPLAGVANVRAELLEEAGRQEYIDRLASAALDAPEDATRFELWTDEAGSVELRVLLVVAGVLLAGAVAYLLLPYLVGVGVIYGAYRHLTRGTHRRRPKSSWSSLGRTAALMFAAWNSRWLKPANVTRGGRPLRVSVPAAADGEPNPLDELD